MAVQTVMLRLSVVVPASGKSTVITPLLESLENQSLDLSEFEVIVVLNGDHKLLLKQLEEYSPGQSLLRLKTIFSAPQGASRARNIGKLATKGTYITFVDADDRLGPDFLRNGLNSARPAVIGAQPIMDFSPEGNREQSSLDRKFLRCAQGDYFLSNEPWVLSFVAGKFVHRNLIQNIWFNEDLKSGEDVAFFAEFLKFPELKVRFGGVTEEQSYKRIRNAGSLSRQPLSYEFNVSQRLSVLSELQNTLHDGGDKDAVFRLASAQSSFIRKFLKAKPEHRLQVVDDSRRRKIRLIDWGEINRSTADGIAFCYCFPPYADPSGTVAAKRLSDSGSVWNVISNGMDNRRRVDYSLPSIAVPWIDKQAVLCAPPSFGGWRENVLFAKSAVDEAFRLESQSSEYVRMYSRSHWIGSHFAAALFSIERTGLHWTAEFSDPLRFTSDGKRRSGVVKSDGFFKKLSNELGPGVKNVLDSKDLYAFIEAYVLTKANKIIFTNQNQADFVLSSYPPEFARGVYGKVKIVPQSLPQRSIVDASRFSETRLPSEKTNIAYFGSFYKNRGLNDLLAGLLSLPPENRHRFSLDLYVSDLNLETPELIRLELEGIIVRNRPVDYLEFLGRAQQYDALIVVDVESPEKWTLNPYLPSKLSDYLATGAPIWAFVEAGSPLDRAPGISFKTFLGDLKGVEMVLAELLEN